MNNDQNNKKMQSLEDLGYGIMRVGAVLIAVAIVLFCFAYTKIEPSLLQSFAFIFSGLLGALGLFIMMVGITGVRAEKNKTNFFLYDKKEKRNVDPSDLTVAEIRKRISELMSTFKHKGQLYIGDLFDEKRPIPEQFKPLFCYEVLCRISEGSREKAETFLSFGYECAEVFSRYLSQNGDYELALKVRTFISNYSSENNNTDDFCSYITSQKQHIEEKMLNYTIANIEKFGSTNPQEKE